MLSAILQKQTTFCLLFVFMQKPKKTLKKG